MIKNKRKVLDSNINNLIRSKYIEFINKTNKTKEPIKIRKFKSFFNDKKSNINDNNLHFEIISTYNYIINKVESLMNSLNYFNYDNVYSQLINIKKAINKITSNNIRNRSLNKNSEEEDKYNSCSNFRISFDKELSSYNKSNSDLNMTSFRFNNMKNSKIKLSNQNQKNSDLEDKLKTENLKYLFCIGEQNIEIKKLEQELTKNSFDNMSQNELKDFRCFPYYKKFDISDSSSNQTKRQNVIMNQRLNSLNKKQLKKIYYENYIDKSDNQVESAINNNREDLTELTNKDIIEYGEKVVNEKKLKGNRFIDRKGKYYISHPKLKYIKNNLNMKSWKTNELLDSFPKELLRHKFTSKSQKDSLIVFPSSLNQIITNLEKLRIHNNFTKMENDFKEKNKIIK
jgi:hypothetical protein